MTGSTPGAWPLPPSGQAPSDHAAWYRALEAHCRESGRPELVALAPRFAEGPGLVDKAAAKDEAAARALVELLGLAQMLALYVLGDELRRVRQALVAARAQATTEAERQEVDRTVAAYDAMLPVLASAYEGLRRGDDAALSSLRGDVAEALARMTPPAPAPGSATNWF